MASSEAAAPGRAIDAQIAGAITGRSERRPFRAGVGDAFVSRTASS